MRSITKNSIFLSVLLGWCSIVSPGLDGESGLAQAALQKRETNPELPNQTEPAVPEQIVDTPAPPSSAVTAPKKRKRASAAAIAANAGGANVKRFNTRITGRYNGSFLNYSDFRRRSSMTLNALVVFRASDLIQLQGVWGFNQILEPAQEFNLTNPEFRMFYRLLGKPTGWSLAIGPTVGIPINTPAQNESLQFAFGGASRVIYNGQGEDGGWLFLYDTGFNRNIHQFETARNGSINTQFSVDHLFYLEYAFASPITLNIFLGFSSAWSYLGDISNAYISGQEMIYNVNSLLELALGHERGGDYLSPSGQNYNFRLFRAEDSRFYVSSTLRF
jgi:hypothetical protein